MAARIRLSGTTADLYRRLKSPKEKFLRRVLIGEFDVMVAIGMRNVLASNGCDVVSHHSITPERVAALRPAAIVVDLDDIEATTAAEELIPLFPHLSIIECSSSTPTLRVFPAKQHGRSEQLPLTIDALVAAVPDCGSVT